jgi:hypothetical protein
MNIYTSNLLKATKIFHLIGCESGNSVSDTAESCSFSNMYLLEIETVYENLCKYIQGQFHQVLESMIESFKMNLYLMSDRQWYLKFSFAVSEIFKRLELLLCKCFLIPASLPESHLCNYRRVLEIHL